MSSVPTTYASAMLNTLEVSEFFGPTLQGEGPHQGRPALFLRLGRCNLTCSWCDTPYTWDWERYDIAEEVHEESYGDLMAWARSHQGVTRRLVISGGEPMMQQHRWAPMASALKGEGWSVEVETNGTIAPRAGASEAVSLWSVSPKIANSGVVASKRFKHDALRTLALLRSVFKFVVAEPSDLEEVEALVALLGPVESERVWLMPEGRTAREVLARLPWVFDACSERGWSLAPRLHVLAYDDERGR